MLVDVVVSIGTSLLSSRIYVNNDGCLLAKPNEMEAPYTCTNGPSKTNVNSINRPKKGLPWAICSPLLS